MIPGPKDLTLAQAVRDTYTMARAHGWDWDFKMNSDRPTIHLEVRPAHVQEAQDKLRALGLTPTEPQNISGRVKISCEVIK